MLLNYGHLISDLQQTLLASPKIHNLIVANAIVITYAANDGSGKTIVNKYMGREVTVSLLAQPSFTPPAGQFFSGWSLTPTGDPIKGSSMRANASMTLYAIWGHKTINIVYMANNGTDEKDEKQYMDKDSIDIDLSEPTGFTPPTGMSFKGWSYSPNGAILTGKVSTTVDKVLYAFWQKKITFSYDDGRSSVERKSEIYWGDSATITLLKSNPFSDYPGYRLKGWSYTKGGEIITDSTIKITTDTTVYAIWEENVVKATYYANNGTGQSVVKSYSGTQADIPLDPLPEFIPKTGYIFMGWAYTADASKVISGTKLTITKDTSLYAIWLKPIVITRAANNGSGATITKTYNQFSVTIDLQAEPSFKPPSGKVFQGWSYSPTGSVISGTSVTLKASTTLYSIWGEATGVYWIIEKESHILHIAENPITKYTPHGDNTQGWCAYDRPKWFNWAHLITSVQIEEKIRPTSLNDWFALIGSATRTWQFPLQITNVQNIDLSRCGSLEGTFNSCWIPDSLMNQIAKWDTVHVSQFTGTFLGVQANYIDISGWNTCGCKNAERMFYGIWVPHIYVNPSLAVFPHDSYTTYQMFGNGSTMLHNFNESYPNNYEQACIGPKGYFERR